MFVVSVSRVCSGLGRYPFLLLGQNLRNCYLSAQWENLQRRYYWVGLDRVPIEEQVGWGTSLG